LIGDDYVYSFVYLTPERLSSVADIFDSQYKHYFIWGGRSVVHIIAQILLLINNPLIIDGINSFGFLIYALLIYYHITGEKKLSLGILIFIFGSIWLLQPAFAETFLWITGAANYMWGTIIILLFLLPYRLYSHKPVNNLKSLFYSIGMLFAGVIAGWTNENTAAGMVVITFLCIIYFLSKKWSIPMWMYTGLFGAIIGYILMIAAPGNFNRAEGVGFSLLAVLYRFFRYTDTFIQYLGAFNLVLMILLILYKKFRGKLPHKNVIPALSIYFAGIFVSIYVMVVSPGFPARAWFGPITLNIIAGGIILYNLNYDFSFLRKIKYIIILFMITACCLSIYDSYKDVDRIDKIWKGRYAQIEEMKKINAGPIVFEQYYAKTKFGLSDATYAMKAMSEYYGIEIIIK